MRKILLLATALVFGAVSGHSQCLDWVSPDPEGGWTDFDPVPCNGESQEITGFEVWQSEAYTFAGVITGGMYTFSHCNGASGTWVPEYTVIAPSGAIDTFGPGDGDGCSITWTASEDGDYLVVINEADNCGVAGEDNNGFPMIMTISGGEECGEGPVFIEGAESFEGGVLPECWMSIDEDGDGFEWNVFEGAAFEGEFSIRSESWDAVDQAALTPNNYLITPQLELGVGDSLYYLVAGVDPNFAAENYSVLISTTGTDIADFTDEIFTETLELAEYEGRNIDLSAYDNQTIYIAFRHHNVTDQFFFVMDGVALPGTVICEPMSTNDLVALDDINIFPNPNNGLFSIMNNGGADLFTISIFDVTGKMVSSEKVQLNTGSQYNVDLSSKARGLYSLQFVSETKAGTFKVVVE